MPIILSIVPYKIFPAKVGGQKGIAFFNEYLAKEIELVCVTVRSNDPKYGKGYTVLNTLTNSFYRYIDPFYFFYIRKLIKKYNITHLLLEHPYFGWLGILIKISTGVKLIVHSHNIEATRWKSLHKPWWKILWWYERLTHRMADFNFFIQDDDRHYAIEKFGLHASKCITVTYGIEFDRIPPRDEIQKAKQQLRQLHGIGDNEFILLFNGAFNYQPNLSALKKIIEVIDPLLQTRNNFPYKIIICGRDIPDEITSKSYQNIIFAGFVDDISTYFKGADIFLNPVNEGGGIKTKLVEALAYNMNAVSTINGAIGIDPVWCNGKLLLCDDNDWNLFSELVVRASTIKLDILTAYFEHFYWGYIIKTIASFINK